MAYLYLPRIGKPPFQTVVHWPGAGAFDNDSIARYGNPYSRHNRSGRAWVLPLFQGMFERKTVVEEQHKTAAVEAAIKLVKDFKRTIDYLETRPPEFDASKLAYEGLSWGACWGGVLPAIESRVKVAVLRVGGLNLDPACFPAECSQVNFAPRIKIPILLQNGKRDEFFPIESKVKPFFALFGTAEKDKQLKIYDTGHFLKDVANEDELAFLDKYLGPVK